MATTVATTAVRRWILAVSASVMCFVVVALVVSAASGGPAPQPVTQPGPLVVVGMPRLTWDDVSPRATPAIWSLARSGADGALITRAYADHSCSADSWLTLSAGFAAATFDAGRCAAIRPGLRTGPSTRRFAAWPAWRTAMDRLDPAPPIGMLADTMARGGGCIGAAGAGARLGAADGAGRVRHVVPVSRSGLDTCPVTFVSLPRIDDAAVAAVVAMLPARTTVVLAGMADDAGPVSLHAVVLAGPGVRHGTLTSQSTRQPGLLETTDLTALVLSRLRDRAPVLRIGRVPEVRPGRSGLAMTTAAGLTHALDIEHPFVPGFFALFLGVSAALLAAGLLRWLWITRVPHRASRHAHVRVRRWFAVVAAMCASMPAATFLVGLVPWWRFTHPRTVLCVGVAGICAVLAAAALLGPWRRLPAGPPTFIAVVTWLVIAQDVVHGSRLQLISVMGLQPVYGGRYFGMGNVGAALWLTSGLFAAAMLGNYLVRTGQRGLAATTVAAIGAATLLLDSAPWWGDKAGAMLAITPAFGYLTLKAGRLRLTWPRALGIVAITVLVAVGFTAIDTLPPPQDRTHIGNFGAEALSGDFHGLGNIVRLNWHMLTSGWLNGLVLVLIVVIVVYLARPAVVARPLAELLDRLPLLGAGISAVALCWLLSFVAEDSGTAIPPTGLLVLAPLMTMLAARLPVTANPRLGAAARLVGAPGAAVARGAGEVQ